MAHRHVVDSRLGHHATRQHEISTKHDLPLDADCSAVDRAVSRQHRWYSRVELLGGGAQEVVDPLKQHRFDLEK